MRRTNDAIVGGVVLAVIAALVAAVTWIKQSDVRGRRHEVVAHFRDVGNARVGNSVVIRGVVGGRIDAIELAANSWVNVRMKLDPSVQLPAEPVVLLSESSLFGDWQATVVERRSLPADASLRTAIDDASRDAGLLPGASLPGIGKLTAVAGQIAGDVATAASRIGTAFDDQAARELRASIQNVSTLSSTLRRVAQDHASDLDTLSGQLRIAVSALNAAAHSVDVTARRIDSATSSREAKLLVDNFTASAEELRHAAVQVRDLTARLSTTQARADAFLAVSDSVLAKINRGDGTMGLLVNDPSVYRRADTLLRELTALATDMRANPKKYVSVRLF